MIRSVLFVLLSLYTTVMASSALPPRFGGGWPGNFVETCDLREVYSYLEPGTLVVIELENVLMESQTQLGSEQWADAIQGYFTPPGGSARDARAALTPLWNRILRQAEMRPVDMSVQAFVRGLQRKGFTVMGISGKDPDMAYTMLDHLQSVDLDLSRTSPYPGHMNVVGATHPAKLVNGVLFTGVYNDMGLTVATLFQQLGFPGKVVVISNKKDHLRENHEALAPLGIAVVGIRLTLADQRIARFRSDVAEVQLNFFGRPLSNEAAAVLIPKTGWFW